MPNAFRSAIGPIVVLALLTAQLLAAQEPAQQPKSERVTQSLEGVSVTVPADEADLAEPLLKLAKAWREAIERGTLSKALRGYLEDPKAAENSMRLVADHLGVEGGVNEAIRRDWQEAAKLTEKAVESWGAWQDGFDTMHFWTKKEAEAYRQRDRLVFRDSQVEVEGDGAGFRIRPSFLPEPVDLEAIPDAENVEAYRLDFVLAYPIGATPGAIVRQYSDLLNKAVGDPHKGLIASSAADIFEEMYRQVFEKALKRRLITDDKGKFFRRAISYAFNAARNDQVDPERGRRVLFGWRIRNVANQEWQESIADLAERMRKAPAWPADSDGPAERAVREVALAMVFLSLKNGGASVDGWIQAQEEPLDADAFSARLAKAASDDGWESVFHSYCQSLAEQFEAAFADPVEAADEPSLSAIEQQWPRAVSGRVEVVHPPVMELVAKLSAEKIDAILGEFAVDESAGLPPVFAEKHEAVLLAHGLQPRQRSAAEWSQIFERMALGGVSKLLVRFWFVGDAMAEMEKGTPIPGMELDEASGEITVTASLGQQTVFASAVEGDLGREGDTVSYLIVPIPKAKAAGLPVEVVAETIAEKCRTDLGELFEAANSGDNREERFFLIATMVVGEALIRDVIASKDREWFVTGFAHWLAMKVTDAEFGNGAGRRVFDERWPADKGERDRDKVDLTKWLSTTDGESRPYDGTHIYFATLAVEAAFEGKDAEFVKRFIEEIRKTPRKRTNIGTVYRAYKEVGGGNLKKIAQQVSASPNP